MKQPVVLDSFALISFFHQEAGWETVFNVFKELTAVGDKAALSRINWGEFYYIVKRRVGREKTLEALALLEQLPIDILPVDDSLIREAAEIKSEYPIAYADAFCVATAQRLKGRILTSDPEFKAVEKLVSVQWITGQKEK
ncbi:MAG: type II toxin-antitoxin system VapC family toxin [Thermodesulfobacteriota bacterium]